MSTPICKSAFTLLQIERIVKIDPLDMELYEISGGKELKSHSAYRSKGEMNNIYFTVEINGTEEIRFCVVEGVNPKIRYTLTW